jgi:hypothetical protein
MLQMARAMTARNMAITRQILELLPHGLQPLFQNGELRINFLPLPGG